MKTNELTGAALDWAVAKCEGYRLDLAPERSFDTSTDRAQGGPIIEREHINILAPEQTKCWPWLADKGFVRGSSGGPDRSPLIAAMRCYVASKLGAEIEIPKELT